VAEDDQLSQKQKQENRIVARVLEKIPQTTPITPEDVDNFTRFMEGMRLFAASAVLAVFLGSIYEYLALMGVSDVVPARVVLVCAMFFGVVFVYEITMALFRPSRRTIAVIVIASLIMGIVGFFGIAHYTERWVRLNPPPVEKKLDHLTEILTQQPKIYVPAAQAPNIVIPTPKSLGARVSVEQTRSAYETTVNGVPTGQFVPYIVGKPLAYNIWEVNQGPEEALDFEGASQIYIENGNDEIIDNAQASTRRKFKEYLRGIKPSGKHAYTLPVGEKSALWHTVMSNRVITDDDVRRLQGGPDGEIIFMYSFAKWRDSNGPRHLNFCQWLQQPSFAPEVWHVCDAF
jgi:hypothetical protein